MSWQTIKKHGTAFASLRSEKLMKHQDSKRSVCPLLWADGLIPYHSIIESFSFGLMQTANGTDSTTDVARLYQTKWKRLYRED
ncbi:hypothetical protein [Neisseria animalis]|uniref:hypothetical protein n=1 Tax=Neisseria animalis TaxID=492 RepID=UPI000F515438|nr:hypothetical protein [Neisseria animalis]